MIRYRPSVYLNASSYFSDQFFSQYTRKIYISENWIATDVFAVLKSELQKELLIPGRLKQASHNARIIKINDADVLPLIPQGTLQEYTLSQWRWSSYVVWTAKGDYKLTRNLLFSRLGKFYSSEESITLINETKSIILHAHPYKPKLEI